MSKVPYISRAAVSKWYFVNEMIDGKHDISQDRLLVIDVSQMRMELIFAIQPLKVFRDPPEFRGNSRSTKLTQTSHSTKLRSATSQDHRSFS